ncbi:MAG: flagellar hook-basal body protein [Chloroflexota bacterium]
MLKELYTAALSMLNSQTKLEVTANNMANASTAGFKRQGVFEQNLIDARANLYNTKGDAEQNDSPIGSFTDFSAAAMQQTGNSLDIAIEGEGFFLLKDDEGKDFLTRAGNFRLREDGAIEAMDGKLLSGDGGPINIYEKTSLTAQGAEDGRAMNIRVAQSGEIFVNDKSIGHLKIAKVDTPNALQRISDSCFVVEGESDVSFLPQSEVNVRQGWLEGSNVSVVREMVEMIELQRMFEAGSKIIHTNNETLDKSISMGRYQ